MRIPSAKVDQNIFFVALDAAGARKTGLSAFTVYRSRNGATPVVYTTPTIVEVDATHMPGVYCLLVDEDTTIAANSDSEEYAVHISCATMVSVTRTIELYRDISAVVLDRAAGVETGWTVRQALRIILAALGGKASGLATTTVNIRDMADTKNRISATVDANGNRSAVTLDAS